MPVICPKCLKPVLGQHTQYGLKHSCCGLWSWGGKPLVPRAVHQARRRFHAVFDPLWVDAPLLHDIRELPGSWQYDDAVRKIRLAARKRAYAWLSWASMLPEPDCHGSTQTSLKKLHQLIECASHCTGPVEISEWASQRPRGSHATHNDAGRSCDNSR